MRAGRDASWHWAALSTPVLPAGERATDGRCTTVPLWKIHADPSHANELWALGATEATGETGLRRSVDGATSWEGLAVPDLLQRTVLFDVAPNSPWAGNVLVFDGPKWVNASPPEVAGYDRPHTFAALASTSERLLAVSSRGELMSFAR